MQSQMHAVKAGATVHLGAAVGKQHIQSLYVQL
jgi:hypothetical protein